MTIDALRAAAIVMMVAFHFIFDLREFNYHDWQIPAGLGWANSAKSLSGRFSFASGTSLVASHRSGIQWQKDGDERQSSPWLPWQCP